MKIQNNILLGDPDGVACSKIIQRLLLLEWHNQNDRLRSSVSLFDRCIQMKMPSISSSWPLPSFPSPYVSSNPAILRLTFLAPKKTFHPPVVSMNNNIMTWDPNQENLARTESDNSNRELRPKPPTDPRAESSPAALGRKSSFRNAWGSIKTATARKRASLSAIFNHHQSFTPPFAFGSEQSNRSLQSPQETRPEDVEAVKFADALIGLMKFNPRFHKYLCKSTLAEIEQGIDKAQPDGKLKPDDRERLLAEFGAARKKSEKRESEESSDSLHHTRPGLATGFTADQSSSSGSAI